MRMIRRFIFICVLAAGFLNLSAQESDRMPQHLKDVLSVSSAIADTTAVEAEKNGQLVVLPDGTLSDGSDEYGKVIVGNDTVSVILPGKNYSRYDRGLYNHLFMPKGKCPWRYRKPQLLCDSGRLAASGAPKEPGSKVHPGCYL